MLQMRFSSTFIIVFLFIYSTFPRSYTLRRRLHFRGVICMKIPTHVYNALLGSLFVLNGVASFVIGWKISRHFVDQSAGRTSGDLRTFPALEPTVCSCIQIWLVYSFVWAYRHWPGLAWCHSNEDFLQCFCFVLDQNWSSLQIWTFGEIQPAPQVTTFTNKNMFKIILPNYGRYSVRVSSAILFWRWM